MRKKEPKIVYYTDELNNDFAGTNIKTRVIDDSFKYIHKGFLWRAVSFLLYYVLAFPLVLIFEKLILGVKFVNRSALKKHKKQIA